jgi:hypothetical protein
MPPSAECHAEDVNTSGAPEGSVMTCHVQPTVLQRHGSLCLGRCGT